MTMSHTPGKIDTARMLAERSLLVSLSISRWRPRKSDQQVTREVILQKHANTGAGQFVKNLLPGDAMKAIDAAENKARDRHQALTLPWKDGGWRILASQQFLKYQQEQQHIREEFDQALEAFLTEYPNHVASAPDRLRDLFNEADFPTAAKVRAAFAFRVEFCPMPSAGDFRVNLPGNQLEELQSSLQDQLTAAAEAAKQDVWRQLTEPLKALVTRLKDPDAKFRVSLFENVQQIAELVPGLMLEDDPTLLALAQEACEVVASPGLPESVRLFAHRRRDTVDQVEKLLKRMQDYMPVATP
jgi:hypothetical protein